MKLHGKWVGRGYVLVKVVGAGVCTKKKKSADGSRYNVFLLCHSILRGCTSQLSQLNRHFIYFLHCHSGLRRCISQLSQPSMYLFNAILVYKDIFNFLPIMYLLHVIIYKVIFSNSHRRQYISPMSLYIHNYVFGTAM